MADGDITQQWTLGQLERDGKIADLLAAGKRIAARIAQFRAEADAALEELQPSKRRKQVEIEV
jgi:hypothetical protein